MHSSRRDYIVVFRGYAVGLGGVQVVQGGEGQLAEVAMGNRSSEGGR